MKHELINNLMFDYESLTEKEIEATGLELSMKMLRWLGEHHPDNRTRKIFFQLTGIVIGDGTVINKNFIVSDDYSGLLAIGNRVAISPNVTIICSSGPNNSKLNDNQYVKDNLIVKKRVVIGDDVWIGANALILPGVKIGNGSIIGAGSIVSKDVDQGVIVKGNPSVLSKII